MAEAPSAGRDHVTEMNKNRVDKGGRGMGEREGWGREMAPTGSYGFHLPSEVTGDSPSSIRHPTAFSALQREFVNERGSEALTRGESNSDSRGCSWEAVNDPPTWSKTRVSWLL